MDDRTSMGDQVPSAALRALRRWADRAGVNVDAMADEIGVALPQSSGTLPLKGFLQLQSGLNRLAERRFSSSIESSSYNPGILGGRIDLAMSRLPTRGTLRDAMRTMAMAVNAQQGREVAQIEARPGLLGFVLDDRALFNPEDDPEFAQFSMETALLRIHAVLRLIIPQAAAGGFRAVELRRTTGPSPVPFDNYAETRLARERYGLFYDQTAAERVQTFPPPSTLSHEAVAEEQIRMLSGRVDERTFAGRVRLLIEEGTGDQSGVARALGMSVATLRRRLCEEGASFRLIRTQALTSKAEVMLRTAEPLAQIAVKLGFADVRSFSRAYKSWTGFTPNEHRRRVRN
ncbi:helix-turn-helix domain-containing protein [Parvularcula maris]|uniref:Helix-turn-helix transcriptional regulator n=1 Tax=Parvularcula maris TaxID=2965077 RepID=A0A9X2RIR9_9PROT|nr:helix-turn-helix transcriptional regulator [Parvularcula maris]MCQ8186390.1 helix-turn-helix transcriptional regulator [Parvularcula maris]